MRQFTVLFATTILLLSFSPSPGIEDEIWVEDTNLYVVLVKFAGEAPYGWSGSPASAGSAAYKKEDFERMFGISGTFKGTDASVATNESLLELCGSVEDYFDHVSSGDFNLSIEILNPEDALEYPEWLEVAGSRSDYLTISSMDDRLYRDVLVALRGAMMSWYPKTYRSYSIPGIDWGAGHMIQDSHRRQNKLAIVYTGWTSARNDQTDYTGLHPRAGPTETRPSTPMGTDATFATYYQMGARFGHGTEGRDPAQRFAGIGIHVHEIGHLLGLDHGGGSHTVRNPYLDVSKRHETANFMAWSPMSSVSQGPPVQGLDADDSDYAFLHQYQSCPPPFNPGYLSFLEWGNEEELTETQSQTIGPYPANYHYVDGDLRHRIFLTFRPAESFGKYVLSHQFKEAIGLLIWKHHEPGVNIPWPVVKPAVIPADGRAIFNALSEDQEGATIKAYSESAVYAWLDQLSDPFGAKEGNGVEETIRSLPYFRDATNPEPTNYVYPNPEDRVTPDWATDASHFASFGIGGNTFVGVRNIHIVRDDNGSGYAVANVYTNYLEGVVTTREWSDKVFVGADVTVPEGETMTIADDTMVYFLSPRNPGATAENPHGIDANGTEISEIIVQDGGTLNIGGSVSFRSMNEEYTNADGGRVEPTVPESHGLIVESGGTVTMDGLSFGSGTHRLSGEVTIRGDVTVASGATLTLAQETEVLFEANSDETAGGLDEARSELIVEGTLNASAGDITFGSSSETPSSREWYGIRVESGATADLTNATVRDGVHCAKGPGTLTGTAPNLSNCGTPPTVTGEEAVEFAEHPEGTGTDDRIVADYNATDEEGDEISFELDGADKDRLILSDTGELRFPEVSPPDFEAPAGSQGNTYRVTVRAGDSQQRVSSDLGVSVTVTNVDEEGTVALSTTTPQEDVMLTATLSDPDGDLVVSPTAWTWEGQAPDATTWETLSSSSGTRSTVPPSPEPPERSTYTPGSDHAGWVLRAVVDPYEDGHGAGKRAESPATEPVQAALCAPAALSHDPGNGEALIGWQAQAAGCPAITGYNYQYRASGGTDWTTGTLAAGATSCTVEDLTNGTEYPFELRATAGSRESDPATITFTAGIPDAPRISVTMTGLQALVEVFNTEDNGSSITRVPLQISYVEKRTGTQGYVFEWFTYQAFEGYILAPGRRGRLAHWSGTFSSGRTYTVEAKATNSAGTSAVASFEVPITAPNEPPVLTTVSHGPVDEITQTRVGVYRGTDPDDEDRLLRWTLDDASLSTFQWQSASQTNERALHFQSPPDYETRRSYPVTLTVTDPGGLSASETVTVAVNNVDEDGTIDLSPSPPQTCGQVTATLSDPDGGILLRFEDSPPSHPYGWSWSPRTSSQSRQAPAPTEATRKQEIFNTWVGQRIRVTARYGDAQGLRKTADTLSAAVVSNVAKRPVDLTARPGDGQVSLSWTAPDDCGSAIARYEYQYREHSPPGTWSSDSTRATSVTITGLENDTEYDFEVQARNGPGLSEEASLTATPSATSRVFTKRPRTGPRKGGTRWRWGWACRRCRARR